MARAVRNTTSEVVTPIGCFVAAMAADLGLDHSPSALRTRRVLQRLVEWGTAEGLPLDRELLLDPETVERFVQVVLAAERSRATYRAVLRKVAPLLTVKAPWEPRPPVISRRQVAPPYRPEEVRLLIQDARHQPTEGRRRAARALVALGLGAGLDGRWVTKVGAGDVSSRRGVVTVSVGEPCPRRVVVTAEWQDDVVDLAGEAADEFLVGGRSLSRNRTSHLVAWLDVPTGHPRLAPARLRSTWLVGHLAAGTRLPELCRAAGLQGVTVLSDLLAEVEPLDEVAAAVMLRRGVP